MTDTPNPNANPGSAGAAGNQRVGSNGFVDVKMPLRPVQPNSDSPVLPPPAIDLMKPGQTYTIPPVPNLGPFGQVVDASKGSLMATILGALGLAAGGFFLGGPMFAVAGALAGALAGGAITGTGPLFGKGGLFNKGDSVATNGKAVTPQSLYQIPTVDSSGRPISYSIGGTVSKAPEKLDEATEKFRTQTALNAPLERTGNPQSLPTAKNPNDPTVAL